MTTLITGAGGVLSASTSPSGFSRRAWTSSRSRSDRSIRRRFAPSRACQATSPSRPAISATPTLSATSSAACDPARAPHGGDHGRPRGGSGRATRVVDVNIAGTNALLLASREGKVGRFVLTGSSAVYGDAPFGTVAPTEETVPRPTTLYAVTKLAAERLGGVQARESHGLDVIRTRLTAIYGAWEHDTGVRDTLSPPLEIAAAALRGEPVVVADGQRDWTPGPEDRRRAGPAAPGRVAGSRPLQSGLRPCLDPGAALPAPAEARPGWSWRRGAPGEAPTHRLQRRA